MKPFALSLRLFYSLLLLTVLSPASRSTPGAGVQSTYVLEKNQFPAQLKKFNPANIYVIYTRLVAETSLTEKFFRKDTIINLKGLLTSSQTATGIAYRLLFESRQEIDSVWQTDAKFRITDKAFPAGEGALRILVYDSAAKVTDQFIFNYAQKYKEENRTVPSLKQLMRYEIVYTRADRNKYAASAAWVISIGIDKYEGRDMYQLRTCESDARAYNAFFKSQHAAQSGILAEYHEFELTGKKATKTNILKALKEIAAGASPNDFFVFNFNGMSTMISFDSVNYSTYFIPYDSSGYPEGFFRNTRERKDEINSKLISLKMLQEHIQLIGARKQLIISEAGPSEKFKTEFIKTMMQNSPAIASMLDVNRVIIVPDKFGYDGFTCREYKVDMAPITYSIVYLDSTLNIFQLFADNYKSARVASALTSTIHDCKLSSNQYFEVFFERKFLQQYREIFGDEANKIRGGNLTNKEIQKNAGLTGKQHALLIGTDNYKGKGWENLKNPVYDATEIAEILKSEYDYEVQLLKDPPMDSIYGAIRNYYKTLGKNDQLIVYIAGHGDYDKDLLDDGFIVCTDSKSVDDDPLRNSYIQHTKLKKMINKIPAKQILVLLDICHGGVFDEQVRDNPTSRISNRNVLELIRTNADYTIRKVLSSVGLDAAFDGTAGKHSPFAAYLINILNARGGLEGIVTLTDIHALLQKASLNETATLKISPHLAGFGDNNPLGEYILIPVDEKKN